MPGQAHSVELHQSSLRVRFAAIVVLAIAAAACARLPAGPGHLNFALEGVAPSFVQASREIVVPLTVANTGDRAWDPSRVHLSYHWLWLVPRELLSRSRTLPYHDGIRTELPRSLAPGERLGIEGRLLAPRMPGAYWLQWDMVEEGVTWFAQVAPRQPRRLVIVTPAPADVLAPLPLAVLIVALVVLGRARRGHPLRPAWIAFAAASDVVWCTVSLVAKQALLVRITLIEPAAAADWLMAASALAAPLAALALLRRRARAWALWAAGAFGGVVLLGDAVYYRFFGDILSAPALLGAHQTRQVLASIRSLLTPGLLWFVVDLPFAAWLALRLGAARLVAADRRRPRAAAAGLLAMCAAGFVLGAPRTLASAPLAQMFRDRAVAEALGPLAYHVFDLSTFIRTTMLRPPASEAQVDEAVNWFRARAPLRAGAGPLFGAARGLNLIVVQVESLQDFAVDYRVDGQDVMPHLRRWGDEAFRFTQVTDETNQGRTSDAEFTAFTSLLPLDSGAVAFRYPANHYTALPSVLAERGYATLSAVPFEAGFWNRAVMHPAYGFQRSLFEPDFAMTEQIGWGLNDRDFLQQMVPHLAALEQPFAAWLITLSLHHPFENFPARHKVLRLGALEGTPFGNYLHTMHFFDEALEAFKESLAAAGLLDDSVLMVFGDHDAGFPHDAQMAARLGVRPGEANWALTDRVPWFIRVPRHPPAEWEALDTALPAGQTDFAPTLLGLLGVDAAPLPFTGRNVLGAPGDPPVLRPYGDWIDRAHVYLSHAGAAASCFARRSPPAPADEAACETAAREARLAHDISRRVIVDDLQQRIRMKLAQLVQ